MFGPFLDAQKLAEAQNHTKLQIWLMLYQVVWIGGPSSGKIMYVLAEERSQVEDFLQKSIGFSYRFVPLDKAWGYRDSLLIISKQPRPRTFLIEPSLPSIR